MYGNNDLSLAQLLHERILYVLSHQDYLGVPWIPVKLLVSHTGGDHTGRPFNLPDENVSQLFFTNI